MVRLFNSHKLLVEINGYGSLQGRTHESILQTESRKIQVPIDNNVQSHVLIILKRIYIFGISKDYIN